MTKLRLSRRNKLALVLLFWPAWLHAVASSGGDYALTKSLIGGSGVNQVTNAADASAYSIGEDVSGTESKNTANDLVSGYFSGYASGIFGTFQIQNVTVGTSRILQDGFQVGVPLNAAVQVAFSSPLDPTTVSNGLQVTMIMNNLGQSENDTALFTSSYVVTGSTVVITPQGAWPGNTVFNVTGTGTLQSIDGFVLAPSPAAQFITALDPSEENVVLQPIPIAGGAQVPNTVNGASLSLDIPAGALSGISYVLVSQDPVHVPLLVNPTTLLAATQKAEASGGAYQTPLAMEEIEAYNEQGGPVSLGKTANLSVSYGSNGGMVSGTSLPIRADTLSLWTLDSVHSLWVKTPDSQPSGSAVVGQLSQFSVYALIGGAASDTSSVYVFPVPWRPHGPNAGIGTGQTGTESSGITFTNLPSECTIKIYTLSGGLVRQIQHSDLSGPVGQEKWDGNTSGGSHAASGVYLWRVESSSDGSNGKLMVIR